MTVNAIHTPVLIAGGGPVGVALAMDLATRGVASIVLEARGELPPNPRCNTTNARTMEFLRQLGCADAVRAAGLPADHSTDVVYMTAMNDVELHRFERPTPADWAAGTASGVGSDWPTPEPQHFISQLYMEPVMRAHAVGTLGVDLRLGWELVGFENDDGGVTAEIRDVASDARQTVRAAWLIGADGGASNVRRGIGARLEGIPMIGNACSLFIRSARLTELYSDHPGWMYRFLGGVVLVAIDGKDEWLVHTHPGDADPDSFDPEPQMFAAIGEAFAYETINLTRWTARAMVCDTWRKGRVLLAGDAAHIWIPYGGFGMNSGVGDAMALGWRLAGVVQGWLAPAILDSYEAERKPLGNHVAAQAAKWSAETNAIIRMSGSDRARIAADPSARAEIGGRIATVNLSEWESAGLMFGYVYADSPVIAYDGVEPPPFDLVDYRETSSPGARAPHMWRRDANGRRVALFDQMGKGFTLLRIGDAAPSGAALAAVAEEMGVPLSILDLPEPDAVEKYEAYPLVLVRPDQHIVWRSASEPDVASAQSVFARIVGRQLEGGNSPP